MELGTVIAVLSKAEQEVFFLCLTNMTSVKIAEELKITERGVRFHLTNIFRKTKVRSRLELLSNFVDTTKTDKNLLLFIFELKREIEDLKRQMVQNLPSGINGNQVQQR